MLVDRYGSGTGSLVSIALAPNTAPYDLREGASTERLIEFAQLLAQELNLRVSTISSGGIGYDQYPEDVRRAGRSHVMHLMQLGVLDHRWLLVQPALIDDTDIALMREAGCHAIYTPVHDAMRGISPGRWANLSHEVNCALGTGGAMFDAGEDMVEQIKACMMVQNSARLDAAAMSAEAGLEMATINAARALGLDHIIGSLEIGKRGDIAVFDLRHPHSQVSHKPISTFATTGRGADAHAVFVDGNLLFDQGRFVLELDVKRLLADARASGAVIMATLSANSQAADEGKRHWNEHA